MATVSFSESDKEQVLKQFEDRIAEVGDADIKNVFCKSWPDAKKVLQFFQNYVKGNVILEIVLDFLIWLGDELSSKFCTT
jgi:hypothetical protein